MDDRSDVQRLEQLAARAYQLGVIKALLDEARYQLEGVQGVKVEKALRAVLSASKAASWERMTLDSVVSKQRTLLEEWRATT